VALTLGAFALLAKDSPHQPPPKPLPAYARVLAAADCWWFCGFYAVTFGGFVGLASFLSTFFKDQYFAEDQAQGAVFAGYCTTICVIAGSFLRPVGGYLADRMGGQRLLIALYLGVAVVMAAVATLPPLGMVTVLLFLGMGLLGMGNGAVFQLVPQRFPKEIGVITGIVGAAGGLGGFLLPNVLGTLKGLTGSFGGGFLAFAAIGLVSAAGMVYAARLWERRMAVALVPVGSSEG
jgi:NNP family nitrate/nitrite transporter-like MFS transporter